MAYGFYHEEGIAIPHKPIPLAVYLVVEEAMRVAWTRLKSRPAGKFNLVTADEDVVTLEFYQVLVDEVFAGGLVDGFDTEKFTVVTREAKVRNFDGKMPDKMPDLLVGLAGREQVYRRTQDWLFVECKPVDEDHTAGVHYGAKGITRFIEGDYAWSMTNALMVGYVSPGYDLVPKLTDALRDRAKEFQVLEAPRKCPRSPASAVSVAVHFTQHGRTFVYVETGQPAPPIKLRHLWLARV